MTSSLDRKLERVAREIEEAKRAAEKAKQPRDGLTTTETATDVLPEGVWESGPGIYKATCRRCGRNYELPCDPSEFNEDGNYCGGQPGCTP